MPLTTDTMLDQEARRRIHEDASIGGGNAWQKALEYSPHPDITCLLADRPVNNCDGVPQSEFSLRQLSELSDSWASFYWDRGVRRRDRVVVYIDDSFDDQLQLAALARLGAIPLLINGRMDPEVALSLMIRTDPIGLYTDAAHLAVLAGRHEKLPGLLWTITADDARGLGRRELPAQAQHRHGDDDPVFLCHSSGTTGVPKAVIWAHKQSLFGPGWRLSVPEDPAIFMSAAPQSHSSAIAYTSYSLLCGLPLISFSDQSGQGVARGAREHRPTRILAFNQTYSELAAMDMDPDDFASVREWQNTGDSAHDAHIRKLIQYGHHVADGERLPGSVFSDGLGSSELGWATLRRYVDQDTPPRPRFMGNPVPAGEVAVLRHDGTPAADGEVGLFGLRSRSVVPGYWNDADTYYRSRLAGYWLSGDLAYREGEDFFHVDRASDAIHTSEGPGYSVLMEELILLHLPQVTDCAVVAGRRDDLVLPVAVVKAAQDAEPAELLARANTALREAGQPPLVLLEVADAEADFPTGPTGKVLKRTLREKYADLQAYAEFTTGHFATSGKGGTVR
ncbi:long-chain fatty acid--CoA ligase (plasmid) [Streptomyces sp. NBC_01471]|uniref:long-chain fatty acid--CoA ligase n=1 Tax=Streptomyces sp. NBC_01471 TaxID=2903879 RepID=UPI002F90E9CD